MWSLFHPSGFQEPCTGPVAALSWLLDCARDLGWAEEEVLIKGLIETVQSRERGDTYYIKTPLGVYCLDNNETYT